MGRVTLANMILQRLGEFPERDVVAVKNGLVKMTPSQLGKLWGFIVAWQNETYHKADKKHSTKKKKKRSKIIM